MRVNKGWFTKNKAQGSRSRKNQGSRVNSLKHMHYKTWVMFNNRNMLWNSSKTLVIYLEEKFRNTCLTRLYNYYWSILDQLCCLGFYVQPLCHSGFDLDTQVFLLKLYWARWLIARLSLVHCPLSVFPTITYRVEIPYVRCLGMLDISLILILTQRYSSPTRYYEYYINTRNK